MCPQTAILMAPAPGFEVAPVIRTAVSAVDPVPVKAPATGVQRVPAVKVELAAQKAPVAPETPTAQLAVTVMVVETRAAAPAW